MAQQFYAVDINPTRVSSGKYTTHRFETRCVVRGQGAIILGARKIDETL